MSGNDGKTVLSIEVHYFTLFFLTFHNRGYKSDWSVVCRWGTPWEGHVAQADRSPLVGHAGLSFLEAVEAPGYGGNSFKTSHQGGVAVKLVGRTGLDHEGVDEVRGSKLHWIALIIERKF